MWSAEESPQITLWGDHSEIWPRVIRGPPPPPPPLKGYSEQLDLEKYYDIYDISDFDISDAQQGFSEKDFEDAESLRTLKIAAARFHTIRKIFLCALLALEANGDSSDFERWSTAVEALRTLNEVTKRQL